MLWRQGDVLIAATSSIPEQARRVPHCTLAEGEATGHTHRIDEAGGAELFEKAGTLYLQVFADSATVVHQEHGPITLARGTYRVWQQREYSPGAVRRVTD
jgi:hypothetical protein